MFQQVQPQKYYMQIAKQIRDSIRDGSLKIGEKLPPERTLALQFGASRASIREALSALEMLGLIDCKSGQGNFIKADGSEGTIDGELLKALLIGHDPLEIFEARLELEPPLAALAAERASEEEKEIIRRQVEILDSLTATIKAGDQGDIEKYMEEDRKFHLEIGRASHNSVLFTVFSGVNLMMKETLWKVLKSKGIRGEGSLDKYAKEHHSILDAICDGRGDDARREMREHIRVLKVDIF